MKIHTQRYKIKGAIKWLTKEEILLELIDLESLDEHTPLQAERMENLTAAYAEACNVDY